jgi:hypothetical protein
LITELEEEEFLKIDFRADYKKDVHDKYEEKI